MQTEDELVAALRDRAADPDRRLECRTSAFTADVSTMSLGGLLGSLREVQTDLVRHLADPTSLSPDVLARAAALHDAMSRPGDAPLPPPTDQAAVDAAAASLDVVLPPLLRRLLTEVANGGFGPGYGLLGIGPGGWTDDHGDDLVGVALGFRGYDEARTLVPLAYLGDVMYAFADTSRDGFPVVVFDGNDEDEPFLDESPSLAGWLAAWAATPGHAAQEAALQAQAADAERSFFREAWSGLTPQQRAEYGITDEMVRTGEVPPDWR